MIQLFRNINTQEICKGIVITQTKSGLCSWGTGFGVPFIVVWQPAPEGWKPMHLGDWEPIG